MATGGTEAFPDLGKHCQHSDCNQLDFLPFKCSACQKVFCLDHRSYKSHNCPKSDDGSRKVMICETCSVSIETTGCTKDEEKLIMEKHMKSSDCDPNKKKKPKCGAKRCKQVLTFSNTFTCKNCYMKVCLNHRFPADHACVKGAAAAADKGLSVADKFLRAFAVRTAKDCSKTQSAKSDSPKSVSVF